MDGDLIALVIALGLGAAVVVTGMRRDLSATTRDNLPRFEGDSEPVVATGPSEGGRKPFSPRQARWLASLNLLLAVGSAAEAVLSSQDRLLDAASAALFALAAVVLMWRASRHPAGTPAS